MEREQIFQNTLVKQYGLPLLEGSFAGLIATVPMTIFMLGAHRILPQWQRYALPPEKLTDKFLRRIGLRKHVDKRQVLLASLVSHLGFGAAVGAIYGPLTKSVPLPSILKGIVYGIVVWLANYMGWLPVVGLSEAANKQPIQRNMLMIVAHIVWGAGTGVVTNVIDQRA